MARTSSLVLDTKVLFAAAELRAERLIALLRLATSVVLGSALILSLLMADVPDADILNRQILFAVVTMGSYFLLGVGCLVLIRKQLFRPWMTWPSATGDCVFILASTWMSVVNTGLPGYYVVIYPTLWLIPVVLACGALRFNPALQAFIAGVLVVGVLGLLSYVPDTSRAPDPEVLEFFFGGPPNVMRAVMIGLAGAVLVVASARMRRMFRLGLEETERRINLTRYLPSQIAPALAQSGLQALQGGVRQNMAILFVDMRGFTHMAEEMDPEELTQFMTSYRTRIATHVARAGGIIDKFMGDAAMIVFDPKGVPRDAAAMAVACAETLVSSMSEWSAQRQAEGKSPVSIGAGLHWGTVYAGVVGDETRLEYSVFGDTVNIAARLEAMTKELGVPILASRILLEEAAVDLSVWAGVSGVEIRGRSERIDVFGKHADQEA